MSIKKLLQELFKNLQNVSYNEVISFLVDLSGSTNATFIWDSTGKVTVLAKELSIVNEIATLNINGTNFLTIFNYIAEFKGEIKFTSNGSIMMPPVNSPGGMTYTHLGLQSILSSLDRNKTTKVVLITDGQTNSYPDDIERLSKEFDKKGIEIEIIAISNKHINFSSLDVSEEQIIPGLDIVNMMKKSAKIYTPSNAIIPYELASNVNKKNVWSFLGINIAKKSIPLPIIIHDIINALMECDLDFSYSLIQEELQTLFIEIGMLLGLLYIKFPNYFLENILKELKSKTDADLSEFVQYGFQLKQQNKPFIQVNINRRLIEYREQIVSFKDATNDLEIKGTSLGEESISFFNGIICFNVNPLLLFRSGIYSIDKYGNIFFSFGSNEQAIRQGLRTFFGDKYGFRDSRNSPCVIFGVATQILLYLLICPEINLDNAYIEKLRKLAIIQCGQKVQNRDKSYGNSFIEIWKTGNLPTTHFSTKNTHADLYLDTQINPLGLLQTLWWAVMMMIIGDGLFNAQMVFYKSTLESENIEPNETSLLQYIRIKFSSKVSGTVKFSTIDKKKSVIILDDFPEGATIYESLLHTSIRGGNCHTQTHYSAEERLQLGNKCVWCNRILTNDNFILVNYSNEEELKNNNPPKFIQEERILNANAQEYVPSTVFRQSVTNQKKVLCVLQGTVGSGKTTFSQSLQIEVEKIGGVCINEGTDKYCVNGMSINNAVKRVTTVLKGINRIHNNLIVVIIDTCGERNNGNVIFNYDFIGWKIHRIIPNFDESIIRPNFDESRIRPNFDELRIRQYLCWSLRNVLTRPLHTKNGNFFLNPTSASVTICKKVHTNKAIALFGQRFVNVSHSNELYDILSDIEQEAYEYQEYLNTSMPIDSEVKKWIAIIRQS